MTARIVEKETVLAVDLLRGLFAFLVLLGHAFDVVAPYLTSPTALTAFGLLRPMFGFQWVIGFFFLSGFCIELSCRRNYGDGFDAWDYAKARVTRLYPVYLVVLAGCIALEYAIAGSPYRPKYWEQAVGADAILGQLLMVQGFDLLFASYAPTYTITYEVVCYGLWAGLRRFAPGSVDTRAFIGIGLSLVAFLAVQHGLSVPGIAQSHQIIIAACFIVWLIGALYCHHYAVARRSGGLNLAARWWSVPLLATLLWQSLGDVSGWNRMLATTLLLGGAISLMLIDVANRVPLERIRGICRQAGIVSYPLYVVHGPAIIGVGYMLNRYGDFGFAVSFLALLIASLLLSIVLAIYVEVPALRWRADRRNRSDLGKMASMP
jgi:peptidoglycan/LPS O-acetylase OafA/YrhL